MQPESYFHEKYCCIFYSYKGDNQAMKLGVYNGFFTQDSNENRINHAAPPPYAAINTWTTRIAADGMPVAYMDTGYDTIDAWTGQALVLPDYQ